MSAGHSLTLMAKLNVKKLALSLGIFFALADLLWNLVLAFGGQTFVNSWLAVHFISGMTVLPVTLGAAIIGIVYHFIVGAVIGWVFAFIWNKVQ